MTPEELGNLRSLTGALYRGDQAKMRAVIAEETELRDMLSRLEDHVRHIQEIPDSNMRDLRRIGADATWQAWLAQTRRDLQVRLARVLARKGMLHQALKRSFGRDHAVGDMEKDARRSRAERHEKQRLAQQQSLFCLQVDTKVPRS